MLTKALRCPACVAHMSEWRKKAYSTFGFSPGEYSYADGKRYLFADLVERARGALRNDDVEELDRIVEYVVWAAQQRSDQLASVVDLAFFLPVFRDPDLCPQLKARFPEQLVAEKWRALMEDPF